MAKLKPRARAAKPSGGTFIQRSRHVSPEEKAAFHQVTGAGRSHVVREFLGLTKEDEDAIEKLIADFIDRQLNQE